MPVKDKVNEVAKNVGNAAVDLAKMVGTKANEAYVTGKQNIKISVAKRAIAKLEGQIGAYYHEQHKQGQPTDEAIATLISGIDAQEAEIAAAQQVIDQQNQPEEEPVQPEAEEPQAEEPENKE
jgi:ABC-type Fe3+/spermidine/putrescine transport system ATPase subunit